MTAGSRRWVALAMLGMAVGILAYAVYQSSHDGSGSTLTVVGLGLVVAGLGLAASSRGRS
jgi:hypothetical protein